MKPEEIRIDVMYKGKPRHVGGHVSNLRKVIEFDKNGDVEFNEYTCSGHFICKSIQLLEHFSSEVVSEIKGGG